ncbi:MAG: multidrug efflux pump subunit AcrB, partial [Candidatus Paceibacteria bacterium]
GQRMLVRSDMRFQTLEEIEDYPIGNGQHIRDVARVIKAQSVRNRLSRIDGQYSYFGQIGKESSANIVETAAKVQELLDEFEADPKISEHLNFMVLFSQGELIEASMAQLRSTALWGGGLAAIVLLIFLRRLRVTACVALSIPISALLALAWVYFTGGTFNILTMTGITLGIGMLVDNSVVVIENISSIHKKGDDPLDSASRGVSEVGLAVFLATMTTVVVFLPLIFMSGNPVIRIMFGSLGLPLCISLLFSLLVALVFLPAMAARIVGPRHPLMERFAHSVAPIGRVPGRILSAVVAIGTRLTRGLALALYHGQRLVLAIITPLRWPLAIALGGFGVWKGMQAGEGMEPLTSFLTTGVALESTRGAVQIVSGVWGAAALLGAVLLAVGTPVWRRKLAAPFQARATASAKKREHQSLVDVATATNSRLLNWSLNHRVMATGLSMLAAFSIAIPLGNMTVTPFGEDDDRSQLEMRVKLEDNFTLAEASEEMGRYEEVLASNQELLGHKHVSTRFDDDGGDVKIYWEESLSEDEMLRVRRELKSIFPPIPGHQLRFFGEQEVTTRNRSIVAFELLGPDAEILAELGEQAIELLRGVPGLTELESPLQDAPEQLRVNLDAEKAWQLGVTADSALQNISWALRGFSLPRFHETGRELPFILEYDDEEVAGLNTLKDLTIYTESGAIALASVANMSFGRGPRTIRRHNGQVEHTIKGRVTDPNQQLAVSKAGYAALREMELPRGFMLGDEVSVAARQFKEIKEMQNALLFSIVLVFLLMAILFESLVKPFAVLFTIPFAIVGAYWTLYMTGTSMDSVGYIGLIILVGVVVNNGIVLIDRIDRLHVAGMPRNQAVLEGGASRVRPILMTALTTIFGLLPMVMAEPPSGGIDYRALGTCVAGGLAFSTFFTLWVVPLAYTLVLDFAASAAIYSGAGLGMVARRGGRSAVSAEARPAPPA